MIDAGTNTDAGLVSCIKHSTLNRKMNVIMIICLWSSWLLKTREKKAHIESQRAMNSAEQCRISPPTVTFGFFSLVITAREENVATFRGSEYFCYDLSQNPIQSSSDEITLSFKTWQRNGLLLHTGKSADYVNLALKDGAVSLVINLGSGAFEAIVEPVNGKFNDNTWHDIKVTRNLRQVIGGSSDGRSLETGGFFFFALD